jgi:AcrR family transcriptional regulator
LWQFQYLLSVIEWHNAPIKHSLLIFIKWRKLKENMARRGEHSQEEIKQMILCAAERIVTEDGFSALTVRKIAQAVGYTVGSFYMVYNNMADLVIHINGRTLDEIAEKMRVAKDGYQDDEVGLSDSRSGVEALAVAYFNYANQNLNRWNLIFDYHFPDDFMIPDWYQVSVDAVFSLVETQFSSLNHACPEDKKKQAARTLWAGVHGVCVLSLSGKLNFVGVADAEESVVLLVRNFMAGWMKSLAS